MAACAATPTTARELHSPGLLDSHTLSDSARAECAAFPVNEPFQSGLGMAAHHALPDAQRLALAPGASGITSFAQSRWRLSNRDGFALHASSLPLAFPQRMRAPLRESALAHMQYNRRTSRAPVCRKHKTRPEPKEYTGSVPRWLDDAARDAMRSV